MEKIRSNQEYRNNSNDDEKKAPNDGKHQIINHD